MTGPADKRASFDRVLPWALAGLWILILATTPQHFQHTRDYGADLAAAVASAGQAHPVDRSSELARQARYYHPAPGDRLLASPLDLASGWKVQLLCLLRDSAAPVDAEIWIAKRRGTSLPAGHEDFYSVDRYPTDIAVAARTSCGQLAARADTSG